MTEHKAKITWKRDNQPFLDKRYNRIHTWSFDGGAQIQASASPHVVPLPYSDPTLIDPEEAFIASLASCHMLWFLSLAAEQGYCVDTYQDQATGILAKNETGQLAITQVTLHPHVTFSGDKHPTHEDIRHLHHQAHESCFIANSVKTKIHCQPIIE